MFKNYLKVAVRTLSRQKGYAAINVAGLALGLACALLIGVFIRSEWAVDRFHTKADRIVRVYAETTLGPEPEFGLYTASILAPTLQETLPDVEATARLQSLGTPRMHRHTRTEYVENVYAADPSLFSLFDIQLVDGDAATALSAPNSVLLTPELAQTFFGAANPIGQSVEMDYRGKTFELAVGGLLAPLQGSSHLDIDVLVPFSVYETLQGDAQLASWFNQSPSTYVLLREGVGWQQFSATMSQTIQNIVETDAGDREIWFTYFAQPLTDIHLGRLGLPIEALGNAQALSIFFLVALLILLIACVNYVNLATARAGHRAREVGVRKAIGAGRHQLARQFLLEAILLGLTAFMVALVLVMLAVPRMEAFTGVPLDLGGRVGVVMVGVGFLLSLGAGVLAGIYPAFVLAGFRPVQALRGNWSQGRSGGRLHKFLVVGQFAAGIGLVIATLVILSQLRYTQHKSLGFDQEQVIVLPLRAPELQGSPEVVRAELASVSGVVEVSISMQPPGGSTRGNGVVFPGQSEEDGSIRPVTAVDPAYAPVLGFRMAQGRWFNSEMPTDSSAYVVNEAALRLIEASPVLGGILDRNGQRGPIIGVVEDYHFESLHTEIEPLVLYMRQDAREAGTALVRLDGRRIPEALEGLRASWAELAGEEPFAYSFLDEDLNVLYEGEQRLARLFALFSGLGIFVACLGLFGLAAYAAEQRTKEVGVRKVLGASVIGLVRMLVLDFLVLVIFAFALAAPVAYIMMYRWLEGFAYRITLGPGLLLIAGALTLGIALVTVSSQALRAATVDPIRALRCE